MERTASLGIQTGLPATLKGHKISDDEKVEILLSAYSGPMKETLSGYLQLEDPLTGYEAAWEILDNRHGDKYAYIDLLKKKVFVGPTVQVSDPKGIKQLSDDLECCVRNLSSLGEIEESNTYGSVRVIAGRFKGTLWDDYATRLQGTDKVALPIIKVKVQDGHDQSKVEAVIT